MGVRPNVISYLEQNNIVLKPLCTSLYTVKSKVAFNNVMYAFNCGKCSQVHLIAS